MFPICGWPSLARPGEQSGTSILWRQERMRVAGTGPEASHIERSLRCRLPIIDFAHKTRVVGDPAVAAVLAALDMTAKGGGAAGLDRCHHLELAEAHVACVGGAPGGAMVAEDVRNLEPGTGHGGRPLKPAARASAPSAASIGRAGSSLPGWCWWRRGCRWRWCRAWRGRAGPG